MVFITDDQEGDYYLLSIFNFMWALTIAWTTRIRAESAQAYSSVVAVEVHVSSFTAVVAEMSIVRSTPCSGFLRPRMIVGLQRWVVD